MGDIDPALGINVSFDATAFRSAVLFAMQMGAPPNTSERATFTFKASGRTYSKNGQPVVDPRTDREGNPLDPDIELHETIPTPVQVDCAVTIQRQGSAPEGPVGLLAQTRAVVTLLGPEYEQVKDAHEMVYGGDRFRFGYVAEVNGLFGVSVYTLIFNAIDEN